MADSPNVTPAGRSRGVGAGVLLAVLFGAVVLPLILTGFDHGRGASDQLNYHGRVIRTFAQQWPHPDLHDYLSMTTPGYHLAIAVVAVYVSDAWDVLQASGMLFSLALLMVLATSVGRLGGMSNLRTFAVCLPLACSLYVVSAGIWLLPDNAAWLGVLGVLLIALRPGVDAGTYLGGGLVLLALVFVRQVHLWAAAPLWAAAWLGAGRDPRLSKLFAEPTLRASLRRAGVCGLCTLPAFILVALFVRHWGGHLCPPSFVNWTRPPGRAMTMTPGAGAFILALIGVASSFYGAHLWPGIARLVRGGRWWVLALALVAGLGVALAVPTSYSRPDGRYSGIWNAAPHFPTFADRSLLIAALSGLGAMLLAAWCAAVGARDRVVLLTAIAGFAAAQTVNPWLWQRYIEPLVLILMALFAARVEPEPALVPGDGSTDRGVGAAWARVLGAGRLLGPLALAALLAFWTAREFARDSGTATDWGITPGPPGEPGHVPDPPIRGQPERQILKPGSPSPDN
jgi:hypothetical protein